MVAKANKCNNTTEICLHLLVDGEEKQKGDTRLREHSKQAGIQAKHIVELVAHHHAQIRDILHGCYFSPKHTAITVELVLPCSSPMTKKEVNTQKIATSLQLTESYLGISF